MQVDFLINRALGMVNQGTKYKLGHGGMNPNLATPAPHDQCDCTGFVAWCFGISRKLDNPFYVKRNGGWFETSAIYADIGSKAGLFEDAGGPKRGAVVVFGDAGGKHGHIGLITDVDDGTYKVVHCSFGNDKKADAIQVTDSAVFKSNNPRFGWWSGLD